MALRPYEQQVRRQGIDGTRQQAPSAGYGEGVGEAISGVGARLGQYAQAVEAYNERFDEAAAMELDTAFGEQVRDLENGYLQTQGRGAIDASAQVNSDWDRMASGAISSANGPRQQQALSVLIQRRRDRFTTQADTHLARQTETYVVSQENSHIASLSRDVVMYPVGSDERNDGYLQIGQALDQVAARRGFSPEARRQLGFETFSGVHIATVQSLLDADPEAAKTYMQENRAQIDPTAYARLFPQVRDEANNRFASEVVKGELMSGPDDDVEVEGQRSTVLSPIPPGTRISSGFGPRTSPGGVGSSNHRGIDYAVAPNSPVVAALPGVARVRQDPDGYGTYVEIDHGGGQMTRYAHLSSATIQDGQRVEAGERIALSGGARGAAGAGNSQGPHLHFEYLLNGQARDPSTVIGQERETSGGRTLTAPSFRTVEDVYAFAERMAPDDWRRRQAIEQQGLQALQRERGVRDDREDQARRALDTWLTQNPNATWDQIPSSLRGGVSPSYALSVRNARTQPAGESDADKIAQNTLFNDVMEKASQDPETFATQDLYGLRGLVSETQLNTMLAMQRRERSGQSSELLQSVSGVINSYVDQVYPRRGNRPRTPDQEQQIAGVRESLMRWAEQKVNANQGPPSQEELIGQLRVFLIPTQQRDGEGDQVAFGAALGQQRDFVVPRVARGQIRNQLRQSLGRPPTDSEIGWEYARRVRAGELDPVRIRN